MTLWRRTPRAVYRVYGEDEYLAGADVPDRGEAGSDPVAQEPPSELEQIARGLPEDFGVAPDADTRADRHYFAVRSDRHISGGLLALGLLIVVTASAAGLVVLDLSRHSPPALTLAIARRDPVHPAHARAPVPPLPARAAPPAPTTAPAPGRLVRIPIAQPRRAAVIAWSHAQPPEPPIEPPPPATTEPWADGEFSFER